MIGEVEEDKEEKKSVTYWLRSTSPDWSAFSLSTPGIYRLFPSILGAAEPAVGKTSGKTHLANIRFSSGNVIFAKDRLAFSTAGITHEMDERRGRRPEFRARDTGNPMTITKGCDAIVITIEKSNNYHVEQSKRVFFSMRGEDRILVAYKNVEFKMTFEALEDKVTVFLRDFFLRTGEK